MKRLSELPAHIVDASDFSRQALRACAQIGSLWLCEMPGQPSSLEVHKDPDQALMWYVGSLGMSVDEARQRGATATKITAGTMPWNEAKRVIATVATRGLDGRIR